MEYILEVILCAIESKQNDVCLQTLEHKRFTYQSEQECNIKKVLRRRFAEGLIRKGVYGVQPMKLTSECTKGYSI